MKNIKLFESYFEGRVKIFLHDIKSEVDQYMYHVLDDYQTDSSDDYVEVYKEDVIIYYHKIKVEMENFNDFKEKIIKLNKVIEKEFNFKMEFFPTTYERVANIQSKKTIETLFNYREDGLHSDFIWFGGGKFVTRYMEIHLKTK